ncbi:MAG TPA: DUF151 domain-containing protein [Alloprevotella sp.]|nr:DUF151 domain-containing protein [Alloprevotella sp.]
MDNVWETYIPLEVVGVTTGTSLPDACMLLMREQAGLRRHFTVLVRKEEYNRLKAALMRKDFSSTRLMTKLAGIFSIEVGKIQICYVSGGKFSARVYLRRGDEERIMETEVATAVLLALETGGTVCIRREEFDRLYMGESPEGEVKIPLPSMQTELLSQALELAVQEDNFELASQLRDELRNRGIGGTE